MDRVELEPESGKLDAFWIRSDGIFSHDVRIPAEWVDRADESGVYLAASKEEIESRLGAQSRGLIGGRRESS